MTDTVTRRVWDAIDRDYLVRLGIDLIDIPSPTGSEAAVARFLAGRLEAIGCRVTLQEIEPERFNVLGRLEGDGSGPTLMFNGHMDTSYSGTESFTRDKPGYQPRGFVEDGWLHGLGIHNMKGALAAYVTAVKAVRDAGVRLAGDVLVAGVAGEIETTPVDELTGARFRGAGCGSTYLVTHGGVADMAVIGEPTGLGLMPGHHGYTWARLRIRGPVVHSVVSDPDANAFARLVALMPEVRAWMDDWRGRNGYLGRSPAVAVTAVRGGSPARSRTPEYVDLFLDVRTAPHQTARQVEAELRRLVAEVRRKAPALDASVEITVSVPGAEIGRDEPVLQACLRSHRAVFGADPEIVTRGWSSDAWILNRVGIPTVNYGPSGRGWNPQVGEHVSIQDLYDCTRVYAAMIVDLCSIREGGAPCAL